MVIITFSLTQKDELKKEYIKSMLSLMEEDKKSVLLYVAFDLAVISLVISEKILTVENFFRPVVVVGLVYLLISVSLFFAYYRKMNLAAFPVTRTLLTLDVAKADAIRAEAWAKNKFKYWVAHLSMGLGIALLLAALIKG